MNCGIPYICTENPLDAADDEATYFAENASFLSCLDKIKQITVYWWNRHYPSDVVVHIDFSKEGYTLTDRYEFAGFSHEKITVERYER